MRWIRSVSGSAAVASGLIASPWGDLTGPLLLIAAADVAIVAAIVRTLLNMRQAAQPAADLEAPRAALQRRLVPHLRSRRPVGVIEMQIRWRARAEAAAARRHGLP